ncbi:MAG: hypothetical protein K2O14_10740 [Oscillospiraceae bacterium]|nr:hypothetical protein [Oscillospiraceae bacterium]
MDELRGIWRGKRINNKEHNGEWVEGILYPVKYTGSTIPGGIDYYIVTYPSGGGRLQIQIGPSTLGECTGLRDDNGRLIFEGDIVKTKYGRTKTVIGFVEFDRYIGEFVLNDGIYGYIFGSDILSKECEVIGNIHDNAELIEQEAHNENT